MVKYGGDVRFPDALRCQGLINDDHDMRAEAEAVAHDLREDGAGLSGVFAAERSTTRATSICSAVAALRAGGKA